MTITDAGGIRALWCGPHCHGSAFLAPAAVVGGETCVPGAIPEAAYHLGWILAVGSRPDGHVLMAGLGAGSGATALLHEFPLLRITVVEIDPEIVRLALRHFPLLRRYERDGRVTIVVADIRRYVGAGRPPPAERWSHVLLDAYRHSPTLLCPETLMTALRPSAEALWLNIVEDEDPAAQVRRWSALLREAGWEPRAVMPIVCLESGEECHSGNVLLGTERIDPAAAVARVPFRGDIHRHAEQARQAYLATCDLLEALPPEDAR